MYNEFYFITATLNTNPKQGGQPRCPQKEANLKPGKICMEQNAGRYLYLFKKPQNLNM